MTMPTTTNTLRNPRTKVSKVICFLSITFAKIAIFLEVNGGWVVKEVKEGVFLLKKYYFCKLYERNRVYQ